MKSFSAAVLLTVQLGFFANGLVLTSRDSASSNARVTPTQQVINMLTELGSKGKTMMETEAKTFATYAEWADDESKKLGFEIQDGQAKIEELTAFITKANSDAAQLGREVGSLEAEVAKLTNEKNEATALRKKQHEEYLALSKDYGESVDALRRAIQVVSTENYDRPQAEAFLQSMATKVPGMESVLAALQQSSAARSSEPGAPEVAAYKFQSGGILDLLKSLLEKFEGELEDVESAEANEAHEFDLVELHLTNVITKDTADSQQKSQLRSAKQAASAKAQGELAETKASKADDEALKKEIETTFLAKKAVFEENQQVRAAELKAISKALEIISSPAVAAKYSEHLNFLQLSRSSSSTQTDKAVAVALLQRKASALDSQALALLAKAMSGAGPFTKVIGMIEGLLEKLKEEAAAEADHKVWCDEQLKANKEKRDHKTATVEALSAEIEGLSAAIQDKASSIATLSDEQASLAKAMAEATSIREAEKADNLAAIADAKAGSEAVKQAIVILKEFYSSQEAASESFLQAKQVPEMAAYKGMQTSKGGVIGMLEVIESDFLRLKAETEASEKSAATEHKSFMNVSQASKKQKHEAEVKLKLDKDQEEFEKEETIKDLRSTEEELSKANEYFQYLKPNCMVVHVSYEERAAKRQEEIAALKEAYSVLDKKSSE